MKLNNLWDVSVEITIGGLALPEYVDQAIPDQPTAATRYVESTDGAPFEIRIEQSPSASPPSCNISCHCYVDGNHTSGRVWKSGNRVDWRNLGVRLAPDLIKTYRFGRLAINDDSKTQLDAADKIGRIKVVVEACTIDSETAPGEGDYPGVDIRESISRKHAALHSLTHHVEYGMTAQTTPIKSIISTTPTERIGEYNFLYRSRADLESLLIVPRQPGRSEHLDSSVEIVAAGDANPPRIATPESEGPPSEEDDDKEAEPQGQQMTMQLRKQILDLTGSDSQVREDKGH